MHPCMSSVFEQFLLCCDSLPCLCISNEPWNIQRFSFCNHPQPCSQIAEDGGDGTLDRGEVHGDRPGDRPGAAGEAYRTQGIRWPGAGRRHWSWSRWGGTPQTAEAPLRLRKTTWVNKASAGPACIRRHNHTTALVSRSLLSFCGPLTQPYAAILSVLLFSVVCIVGLLGTYLCVCGYLRQYISSQLRVNAKMKPHLSFHNLKKVIPAFITSQLDYCNSLYLGLPQSLPSRLQLVQNATARLLTGSRTYYPILASLHWCPTYHRIHFKILQALYGPAPPYITELIHHHSAPRSLRSVRMGLLHGTRTRLKQRGNSFCCGCTLAFGTNCRLQLETLLPSPFLNLGSKHTSSPWPFLPFYDMLFLCFFMYYSYFKSTLMFAYTVYNVVCVFLYAFVCTMYGTLASEKCF